MNVYRYLLNNTTYQQGEKIAIAVSGGADSMALLTMACDSIGADYIIALTFDHQLRKESAQEAQFVGEYCKKIGCEHITLKANDYVIKANQNDARNMRYQYLLAYCTYNQITYLLTAHHKDDQNETYYIRLLQNSHLWGLAGIANCSYTQNIQIIRPLLDLNALSLKDYLRAKNILWVEDPSNQNSKYLRTKIRNLLKSNQLSQPNLKPLQKYRNGITDFINIWSQQYIKPIGVGCIDIKKQAFEYLPLELRLYILRRYLQQVSNNTYSLSLSVIESNYAQIISGELFSLGGCLIYSDHDYIRLQHEYRKKQHRALFIYNNQLTVFDNRFHIFHPMTKKFQIFYLGDFQNKLSEELNVFIRMSKKKKLRYIKSLPVVIYDENKILIPNIVEPNWGNSAWKISLIDKSVGSYCQKYFIDPSF
ncbi:MAG: tRNA lysidine(34) synthetase TilS [Alphaproteobacteria bacterium]